MHKPHELVWSVTSLKPVSLQVRESAAEFGMTASIEDLVQWLRGPQYDIGLAALPRLLISPQAGVVPCS